MASDILEIWTHPSDYGGFSPDGDYLILSRTRDSDCLSESNWHVARQILEQAQGAPIGCDNRSAPAYDWRAGHWACGWVEYLMIRSDAPSAVIEAAEQIVSALADYPVLDDSDYSEREWNQVTEYWQSLDVRERVDMIRRSGSNASLFAARRDYLPDDNGYLYDWLRA